MTTSLVGEDVDKLTVNGKVCLSTAKEKAGVATAQRAKRLACKECMLNAAVTLLRTMSTGEERRMLLTADGILIATGGCDG